MVKIAIYLGRFRVHLDCQLWKFTLFLGIKFNQIFNGKIILDTIAKIKREQQEVLEFKEQSGKKGKSKKN
jgi:hypothetical protein